MSIQQNQELKTPDNQLLKTDVENTEYKTLESRFGLVKYNDSKTIIFPYGIAGIPDGKQYCIAELPDVYNNRLQNFRILQSLDDTNLSFIVLPLGIENGLLDKNDLIEGCQAMEIDNNNLMVLLIASVHRSIDQALDSKISVNTKAPILVDTQNMVAAQYIFVSDNYEIRFMLD